MRAVGDTFEHSGIELITVARKTCGGCYFKPENGGCKFHALRGDLPQCGPTERNDESSVIFIPYDKYVVARLKGEL